MNNETKKENSLNIKKFKLFWKYFINSKAKKKKKKREKVPVV